MRYDARIGFMETVGVRNGPIIEARSDIALANAVQRAERMIEIIPDNLLAVLVEHVDRQGDQARCLVTTSARMR